MTRSFKIHKDDYYLDVIRDSTTLSAESKDRYLRSMENLVRSAILARGSNPSIKKSIQEGTMIGTILCSGKIAVDDLFAYYEQYRKGARPSDSTVSSHCVAALALIKRLDKKDADALGGFERLHSAWESCNAESSMNIREKYDNWRASEQQRDNYVAWEDLIEKREELGRDQRLYATAPHVLLCFLTMLPPMRTSDYSSLRLYDETEPTSDRIRCDENYVCLKKTCGRMVINEYKTAAHYKRLEKARDKSNISIYGEDDDYECRSSSDSPYSSCPTAPPSSYAIRVKKDVTVGPMYIPKGTYDDTAARRQGDIPPALFRVLKTMVARRGRPACDWVFLNSNGDPYTGRTFGMTVNRTMKQLFDGKVVTVNLFRHAATNWLDLNHRHNKPVLLFFRHWMMHSANMQREYVLANGLETDGDTDEVFSSPRYTRAS